MSKKDQTDNTRARRRRRGISPIIEMPPEGVITSR